MTNRALVVAGVAFLMGARPASGQAKCLATNTLSSGIRDRIIAMVTSTGARADSGRADAHLPPTTADSVVLVTADSLCGSAAASRAAAHWPVSNALSHSLWLFKVGGNRYVAFDVPYTSGEFHIIDVLDARMVVLASIAM
jgi:hypothetical protein